MYSRFATIAVVVALVVASIILLAAVAHGATYREACVKAYGNDAKAVAACAAMAQDVGRGRRVVVDTN